MQKSAHADRLTDIYFKAYKGNVTFLLTMFLCLYLFLLSCFILLNFVFCIQVCIHRMLEHNHIVKFYGQRTEADRIYLFLEYAPGGELFDRIGIYYHLFCLFLLACYSQILYISTKKWDIHVVLLLLVENVF